ncbi:hypothetical protein RND71_026339 [Anisodus tanguticus]|uniref:Uncharacterized protein n=1 Tax=Anisodus tanguticus TaxID=243964 RepID=A0AAE1VB74_9SOLA|nr:hypothetical protein RND71_026339 [Anisodus tanguticus]
MSWYPQCGAFKHFREPKVVVPSLLLIWACIGRVKPVRGNFRSRQSSQWKDFKSQLQDMLRHSGTKGIELKKPNSSLYTFPMPDCM